MFGNPEAKGGPSILGLILRGSYLTIGGVLGIASLLIALFPGTTRDEIRYRGINGMGGLILMASLVLATPLVPYVFWKLVTRKRSIFWGIALLVAGSPWLMLFVFGILGH